MKFKHELTVRQAGPVWGIVFGLLMTLAGIGLWCGALLAASPGRYDESLAIAAIIVGVFAAIYAAHELRHR
jgi:hypothetical protein